MASSDEEGEIAPVLVTDYCFTDHNDEPISFSILPFHLTDDEIPEDPSINIFLHGASDNGLQKICKKVIGWAFELSYAQPEIYVLSNGKTWIKLQNPRKSFEDTIRTLMITVHCLHFVKKNPEASKDSVWNYLRRLFRSQMVEPSEKDLLEHVPLIEKSASADKDVEQSKYLATYLNEIQVFGKREAFHELNTKDNLTSRKRKFIVDADECGSDSDDGEDDDDENDGLFDSVCALCDNGGEVLPCEGVCIRSFHPTVDAGADCFCESLGFTSTAQYEAIQTFLCDNCRYEQHQCFICGMLGSSNKSNGAEVFPCVSATCGHFYHPKCVAELLYPSDENQAEELRLQIAGGESFTCPAHICSVCKQGENKESDLQFAVCRRCPKAYHRKCLPRKIAFQGNHDNSIQQRAWNNLLPKRILIYCMDHKIIQELGTPKRDHLLFPCVEREKNQLASGLQTSKAKAVIKKRSKMLGNLWKSELLRSPPSNKEKLQRLADMRRGTAKASTGKSSKDKTADAVAKAHNSITMAKGNNLSVSAEFCSSSAMEKRKPLRSMQSNSHLLKSKKQFSNVKADDRLPAKPVMGTETRTQPLVDTEMEQRILQLMKDSTSSFNAEEFKEQQRRRCNTIYSLKTPFDKTITLGKVEASVKAVRAAYSKLEAGCSVEEAKVVCEPEVLKQLIRWKRKLRVYLAPFLYGRRYTSYGRHFTKVEKLKEIVNRLHWYVKAGDTIVDFCCGKNDFSCLMKEKLVKVGKRCSFKNYDLFTPSNDFSFEKRDWFTVGLGELPAGSSLIMGLNPPFGVKASLANKFIDWALRFKPKLLILIVPKETERLDRKKPKYDLIWEDVHILSGKSFYLPGSVDIHGQQLEDWNHSSPPLYLWSRPDYTAEHKRVAQKHGHLSLKQEDNQTGVTKVVSSYLMEETHDCYNDFSNIISGYGDISKILDDVPEEPADDNSIIGTEAMEIETGNPPDKMEIDKKISAPITSQVTDTSNIIGTKPFGDFMSPSDKHVRSKDGAGAPMEIETGNPPHKMGVNKDLSAPKTSEVISTDTPIIIEAKPYGDFVSPSDKHVRSEDGPQGFQNIQPTSYYGYNLVQETEYFGNHTNIPYYSQFAYPQISQSAYPSATYAWALGTSYGQTYTQPPLATYGPSAYSSESDIFPPGTNPTYGPSAYSSKPDIFPPGTNPTYGPSA